jgi:hypothetical protein
MEVKNLFDDVVKQEIINRIHQLTPTSKALWGKMNAGQMLAHLQMPMGIALGSQTIKGHWLMKLILPLFKKTLYDEKPYKQSLPTDKLFIMTGATKDFEKEKQQLLGMLKQFTEANMIHEAHPVFGKLTKEQWSKATWKHLDHHLKQFGV